MRKKNEKLYFQLINLLVNRHFNRAIEFCNYRTHAYRGNSLCIYFIIYMHHQNQQYSLTFIIHSNFCFYFNLFYFFLIFLYNFLPFSHYFSDDTRTCVSLCVCDTLFIEYDCVFLYK